MNSAAPATGRAGPVLETRGLTIRFGGHVAVNAVSCAFHRGSLTAIVGPNGAGKTTYFNLLSGQLRPTGGSVHLLGTDITRHGVPRRSRLGLGRGFQLTNLYPNLSVLENVRLAIQSVAGSHYNLLRIAARDHHLTERARAALDRVKLGRHAAQAAATLGHGDQRKLEVAILLALEPQVFLFDEPTAGMAADEIPTVLELIEELKREGDKTILLVEHKMDVVRRLADRIVVLQDGRLIADGDPASVVASPAVQNAYLGLAPPGAAADEEAAADAGAEAPPEPPGPRGSDRRAGRTETRRFGDRVERRTGSRAADFANTRFADTTDASGISGPIGPDDEPAAPAAGPRPGAGRPHG